MDNIQPSLLYRFLTAIAAGVILTPSLSTHPTPPPEISETIQRVLELTPPADEGEGGSRGNAQGLICAISPTRNLSDAISYLEPEAIWHDRPHFLWSLQTDKIVIREVQLFREDTDQLIWKTAVTPPQNHVPYPQDAPALESGIVYYWKLVATTSYIQGAFQIMNATERTAIDSQWRNLQTSMAEATPTARTLAQAIYLGEQDLISDMIQVIYSYPQPSEEIKTLQETIIQHTCKHQISRTTN